MYLRTKRELVFTVRSVFVSWTILLLFSGCQTSKTAKPAQSSEARSIKADPELTGKEREIYESRKAIVMNSLDSGKPQQALAEIRQMLNERPNDPTLNNLMGLTQLALRNPARAIIHFKRAYNISKSTPSGLNLCSAYIEANQLAEAERLALKLKNMQQQPAYPFPERILHNLGVIAFKRKQLKAAEQWLSQALEENPAFYSSQLLLADVQRDSRRPLPALESYARAREICSTCIEPVRGLVETNYKLGRRDEARKILSAFRATSGVAPHDDDEAKRLQASLGSVKK